MSSAFALENELGWHEKPITMSKDLFLSQAFAGSMRPSENLPFFYHATGFFDQVDITITTLVISDRFQVFPYLGDSYADRATTARVAEPLYRYTKYLKNTLFWPKSNAAEDSPDTSLVDVIAVGSRWASYSSPAAEPIPPKH
ncbi:hypothetical protein K438DRAFT_1772225 [Mycena galopus ATCC 62051]|nr:hypothetical protein K438DRAFT_1772225 [Mycena galopus ATCC 62051]